MNGKAGGGELVEEVRRPAAGGRETALRAVPVAALRLGHGEEVHAALLAGNGNELSRLPVGEEGVPRRVPECFQGDFRLAGGFSFGGVHSPRLSLAWRARTASKTLSAPFLR